MGSCGWLRRSASGFKYPNGPSAVTVSQLINDPDLGVPDHLARRGREVPAQRARPVCQVHPAHQVRLDPRALLDRPVRPDRQGPRVPGRQGQVPQARGDDVQRLTVRIRLPP